MNNGYYFVIERKIRSNTHTINPIKASDPPPGHRLTIIRFIIITLLKQLELVVECHDNTNIHIVTLTLIVQLYFELFDANTLGHTFPLPSVPWILTVGWKIYTLTYRYTDGAFSNKTRKKKNGK